jgi:serine/threonine protein kinase/ketosteroid isomerase-like protein
MGDARWTTTHRTNDALDGASGESSTFCRRAKPMASALRRRPDMNLCPVCQRCYDDAETTCSTAGHGALVAHRPGSRIIGDRYRLDRLLGRGGVGAVYAASHLELDTVVAVKLLLPALVDDASALERFRREARSAARLSHPSLAATYDFGQLPDGGAYIVMELVDGPTLRDVLDREGPLAIQRAIVLTRRIIEGIDVAHRAGIVHRDLKPSNVMLARDHDGDERPKIVDFGLAKLTETMPVGDRAVTIEGTLIGTPRYMSPEQCAGRDLDPRSDIYSLGVILFEMLAGRPPFDAPTATALALRHINDAPADVRVHRSDVPSALAALVLRMLAKDPADRPQSAAEVGFELAQMATSDATRVVSPRRDTHTAPRAPARPESIGPATRMPDDDNPPTAHEPAAHEPTPARGRSMRTETIEVSRAPRPSTRSRDATPKKSRSSALPGALIGLVIAAIALSWVFLRDGSPEVGELREVPVDSIAAEPMDGGPLPEQIDSETPKRSGGTRAERRPTAPAFDRARASDELRTAITDWIATTNDRDVAGHLAAYAPTVSRFYLERNVPRSRVRAVKQQLFDEASEVRMSVGDARVSYSNAGRTATTRFRKDYEVTKHDGTVSRGAVLQELVWTRTTDGWRIVAERDARILE